MDSVSTISTGPAQGASGPYVPPVIGITGATQAVSGQPAISVSHANPGVSVPSTEDLKSAVAARNKVLQGQSRTLEFQIDEHSKQTVVKVVDTSTQEVLRQMPSAEFLRMAQNIDAFQAHLLHDKA